MASKLSNVFLIGLSHELHTIRYPEATFNWTKISDFKLQVESRTGVGRFHQNLIFNGKYMYEQECDKQLTFDDYNVRQDATIKLATKLPGGVFNLFSLNFADITSENKFLPIDFAATAPNWRQVDEGINFEGTCDNVSCVANDKDVYVQRGFYESSGGVCRLSLEMNQLFCPMCGDLLLKDNIHGVGIYRCRLHVQAKITGKQEIRFEVESRDTFKLAHSFSDDKLSYEYIIFVVTHI